VKVRFLMTGSFNDWIIHYLDMPQII
jgi:hypothetical protein